jgi:hypothetical protein
MPISFPYVKSKPIMYIKFNPAFRKIIDFSFHNIPTNNHRELEITNPQMNHGYKLNAASAADTSNITVASHAIN